MSTVQNRRLVCSAFLVLVACSHGGTRPPDLTVPHLELISPPTTTATVDAPEIGIQVQRNNLTGLAVQVLGGQVQARAFGTSWLVPHVPLEPGRNELRLVATTGTRSETTTLLVDNVGTLPAPRWKVAQTTVYGLPAHKTLDVDWGRPTAGATEVLLDREGDGLVDQTLAPGGSFDLEFAREGQFQPVALLRDAAGILYPTDRGSANVTVIAAPLGESRPIPGVASGFRDMLVDHRNRRVVLIDDRVLRVLDYQGEVLATVRVPSLVAPATLGATATGDLLVTDPPRGRVTRLLLDANYQPDTRISPDGSFGDVGGAPGNFSELTGATYMASGFREMLVTADGIRDEFQLFSLLGDRIGVLPAGGSGVPLPVHPHALRGNGTTLFAIEENGAAVVCRDVAGRELWRATSPVATDPATFVAVAPEGRLVVTHGGSGTVRLFDGAGVETTSFTVGSPTLAAAIADTGPDAVLFTVAGNPPLLERRPLALVPHDDAPQQALAAFLDLLRNHDYAGAAALCEPALAARIAAIDPAGAPGQSLAGHVAGISGTALVHRDATSAHVRISVQQGNDHDVFLRFADGSWRIRLF